jgi:hypothetical protein
MGLKENNNKSQNLNTSSSGGFFQNLFAAIFSSSNPEAEKKRKLKSLAKTISKTKYHAFYKPNSAEFTESFGKLMFDIYKVVFPAQQLYKNSQSIAVFKHHIINYSLSEKQLDLLAQLDEQKISEMAKQIDIKNLNEQVEQKLQIFLAEFDNTKTAKIESIYKAYSIFKDFCTFDYYLLLKKYDSSLREGVFSTPPKLEKVNAEYIIDDLKDFLSVAYSITADDIAWNDFFNMLKEIYGKEFISPSVWKKIIVKIKNIQMSKSLDLIIQHCTQDFKYETSLQYRYESLIEPYIDKLQNETRESLSKITSALKDSKTNSICMQIFGKTDVQTLNYYVESYNPVLDKKGLSVYEYAVPLNYLKTFLIEYIKKDIREYFDVVVIRGQWDSTLSAPISNAYQELLTISDRISEFDEMMSEEGSLGIKIKTLLPKTSHDTTAENIINRVVSDANDAAKGYIYTSTQNLITIGKTVKQLLEDYAKPKPIIVKNWKSLEKFIDVPMKEFCVNIYKKIYLFVQLMQQYLSE